MSDVPEGVDLRTIQDYGKRYLAGEDAEKLAAELGMSLRTFMRRMQVIGVARVPKGPKTPEDMVAKEKARNLSNLAKKMSDIALAMGGRLAEKHLPFIDAELDLGKNLDQIVDGLVDAYLERPEREKQLLEVQAKLRWAAEKLEECLRRADSNWRLELCLDALDKTMVRYERYFAAGIPISDGPLKWYRTRLEEVKAMFPEELIGVPKGLDLRGYLGVGKAESGESVPST